MENKVILVKYADGDEYNLTIEYLPDVAAAKKRAAELLKKCADDNGEIVNNMVIDHSKLRAVFSDGTMVCIYWNEMIKGGATVINFSSDNFGDIMDFGNMADAIDWMSALYIGDYNKYAETIEHAELCTNPFSETKIGNLSDGGFFGYIECRNEDVDMLYKIIKHE